MANNIAFKWDRDTVTNLAALGVPITTIAKRCGKSRGAVYKLIAGKIKNPRQDGKPADRNEA